jgi:hypothetical protein
MSEYPRSLVDALVWNTHAHPVHGARAYADKVQHAAGALAEMVQTDPQAAAPLLKLAVNRVTRALMYVDSSSGVAGDGLAVMIRDYAHACESAPPAPTTLAKWLCDFNFDGPGWPDFRLVWFKDALGPKGLALIEKTTDEHAAAASGSWHDQFSVGRFREQLAEASGDVDAFVAELALNLRSAHDYLPIVDALRGAGRESDAEMWARRGLGKSRPGEYTARLRERLTMILFEAGRGGEAVAEQLAAFRADPTSDHYRVLRTTAEAAGLWDAERASALDFLRDAAADGTAFWAAHLNTVLLGEGLDDEAWRYDIEHPGSLDVRTRLNLVKLRAKTRPEDVLVPYRELIDAKINDSRDTNWRYRRAITMLRGLRAAYREARGAVTGDAEFAAYVTELREGHRRKTAFVKLLDEAGFPG